MYVHGTHPEEQRRLTTLNDILNDRSLRAMNIHLGDRILDVGSGLGQLTRAIARKAGSEGKVIGVEASEDQISEALRQAEAAGESSLVEFRHGSAFELPLANDEWGTFDIVHARFVLEHVTDPQAMVDGMIRAARPGGRVILEDDDHDVLRLSPDVDGFDTLWRAYIDMYRALGCDPHIGRRLVTLLREAGAVSTRNDWKFFGGCHGAEMFDELVANFIGIVDGARDTMMSSTGIDREVLERGIRTFRDWSARPDASMWYGTFWAEGVKGADDTPGAKVPGGGVDEARINTTTESRSRALGTMMAARFLADSARDLSSTLKLEEVYQKIAERVRQFIDYHLFCVMLWNERTELLEFNYSVCFGEHVPLQGGFRLGEGLSGTAAQERRPVRVDNVLKNSRYVRHRHPEVEIRSELVVPLLVRDRLVGVIDLESTEFNAFTHEHEDLMMELARHIAIAVDNAQLYEKVSANESRMENELATARAIQHELVPSEPPRVEGLDIGVAYASATALAGDFYDFLPIDDGRLAFAVGDVAGKSTPAALYGSLAVGILRGEALRNAREPARMLDRMNAQLARLGAAERFVVMIYGVIDVRSRELTFSNAGFPFPYLARAAEMRLIEVPGLPLGVDPGHPYEVTSVPLEAGDTLVFCSDGFADSEDETGKEFGEKALANAIRAHALLPARDIATELLKVTDLHAGSTILHTDDRTAVIIRLL